MGKPDLIAKALLAARIPHLSSRRATVEISPEVRLGALTPDAVLRNVHPEEGPLSDLAAPWSLLRVEATVDLKMPGDHVSHATLARCELRCQARWVVLLEADADDRQAPPMVRVERDHACWVIAPHLPDWLIEGAEAGRLTLEAAGQGCWWVGERTHPVLWVVANELPLREELIPFLIARSGEAFIDFIAWVGPRRGLESTRDLIKELSMTDSALKTLGVEWDVKGSEEEGWARAKRNGEILLSIIERHMGKLEETRGKALAEGMEKGLAEGLEKGLDEGRKKGLDEGRKKGRLDEARSALRRVLARRQLTTSPAQERRIDAAKDIATLERWLDAAVTATSTVEVFRGR